MHGLLKLNSTTLAEPRCATHSRLRALEEYRQHVLRPPDQINLLDCAVLIAKHAYPQLVGKLNHPHALMHWVQRCSGAWTVCNHSCKFSYQYMEYHALCMLCILTAQHDLLPTLR